MHERCTFKNNPDNPSLFFRSSAVINTLHDLRLYVSGNLRWNDVAMMTAKRTCPNAAHPLEMFREISSRVVLSSSMVRLPSITEERFATTS